MRRLRLAAVAYGVLLISLLLTGLAWYYVRYTVQAENRVRFEDTVQATQAAVDRRTDAYLNSMFGARGLILASKEVGREEWERYVRGIGTESRLEGMQALGFAERVEPEERASFVREAREEGLPGLQPDLDPGGERGVYFPLTRMAPSDRANRDMIHRDEYTDPAHRAAIDRARDTGSPQATKMVYVLTGPPPGSEAGLALQPGFAVYLPVYGEGESTETVAGRRRALEGFVVGLLDDVFGGGFEPSIDFEVYDGEDVASSSLLYDYDGVSAPGRKGTTPSSPKRAASGWQAASGACTSRRCRISRRRPRATCQPSCSRAASGLASCSSASPGCSCAAAFWPSARVRTSRTPTGSSKGSTASWRRSPTPSPTT